MMTNKMMLTTTEVKKNVFVSVEDLVHYLNECAKYHPEESTKIVLRDLAALLKKDLI